MKDTTSNFRGAISTLLRWVAFLLTVAVSCYSGWLIISAVWDIRPVTPHRVFMVGIICCVVGCVVKAFHFLVSIYPRDKETRADSAWVAKAQRVMEVSSSLSAIVGLLLLVGLGVVMTLLSGLTLAGKCTVGIFIAVCLVIPLVPAYETGLFRSRDSSPADTTRV